MATLPLTDLPFHLLRSFVGKFWLRKDFRRVLAVTFLILFYARDLRSTDRVSWWHRKRSDARSFASEETGGDQARAALAGHFGAFTLEHVTQAGKTTYLAHGKVDFFEKTAMARTGGAGGPDFYIAVPGRNFRLRSQHERSEYLGSWVINVCV